MFLIPARTPGVEIVREIGTKGEPIGSGPHTLIHYNGVRVPRDALLGDEATRSRSRRLWRRQGPPRDADRRHGPACLRHDVRACTEPPDPGAPWRRSSWSSPTSPTPSSRYSSSG